MYGPGKLIKIVFYSTAIAVLIGIAHQALKAVENENPDKANSSTGINSVNFTKSNDYIFLNAAFDSKGNIHLLWMIMDSNFVYQRSSDLGKSWSRPKALAYDDPTISKHPMLARIFDHPKIISVGNTLTVLWTFDGEIEYHPGENGESSWSYNGGFVVRTSSDDGLAWGPEHAVYMGVGVLDNVYVTRGDTIYIAFRGLEYDGISTFFSKSLDSGLHWDKPKSVGPNVKRSDLSIAVDGQSIHIVGVAQEQEEPNGAFRAGFWHMRSSDLGESWEKPRRFDFNQKDGITASIDGITIRPYSNALLLTLATDDVDYLISKDNGSSWSKPKALGANLPFPAHDACNAGDGAAYIFWIDYRNVKIDWKGRLPEPLSSFLLWDDNPFWANNDLYCAFLKDGHIKDTIRLTPAMSYVSLFVCGQVNGRIIVLWSGKREVEKYVEDSPAPFEIFYKLF